VLIGSYIWNPTYGWFQITAFDSVTEQLTVLNNCFTANAAPGTPVPSCTQFVFGSPPDGGLVTNYFGDPLGYSQALTAIEAPLVFDGGAQATITIATPGTYYLTAVVTFQMAGATTTGILLSTTLKRTNNTPSNLRVIFNQGMNFAYTGYSGDYEAFIFPPVLYTTLNSNDIIDFSALIQTGTLSAGDIKAFGGRSFINAIKLY